MNQQQHYKTLAVGQSDFSEFRKVGAYYIDKSLFIRDVIMCDFQALLLPRPRRFGKTLNLSMLRYFFENSQEPRSKLFDGLAVRDDSVFHQHQGKYPVIYLTFKDVKNPRWSDCMKNIQHVIYKEYARHRELLASDVLFPEEKAYFQKILEERAETTDYEHALERLSGYLMRNTKTKVVILIDEYDTPIQAGYVNGYYDEVISFMRNFLSGGLKDNKDLFKGVLTGILRVSKESIFSGLNNLGIYTLLVQEFNTAFGFTEEDVRTLLRDYGLAERYDEVAYWYNGYLFGGEEIYNPWSVVNYVVSQEHEPKGYWINTGSTDILESLITRGGRELRQELGQLIEGETITKSIYENIVMRDIEKQDHLVWSFLLFSGYLKCTDQVVRKNRYELAIPNEEVKEVYENLIERWFEGKVDLTQLENMLQALRDGRVETFEHTLRQVVTEIMSYHDLSGEAEKVYQALVLGMLVWLSGSYEIRTNRESGLGRYDIMLKPRTSHQKGNIPPAPLQRGIILEFKQVYEHEKPETVLKRAMKQIEEQQYRTELETAGIHDIVQIAVAFRGKEMWLKATQNFQT